MDTSEYKSCFHLPAVVNKAAVSTGIEASVGVPAFPFGCVLPVELLNHPIILCLILGGLTVLCPEVAPLSAPTTSTQGAQLP